MTQILSVFNDVTDVISGSDYLTVNLYLPKVWRMKEILMIKCDDRNEYIKSMATKMYAKFEKYWGESNLLMSIASILDSRYKMKLINLCFPIIYPLDKDDDHIENVLTALKELFESYVSAHKVYILQETSQANTASSSSSAIVGDVVLRIFQS
jgi:hypothetical protein